jgi:hypothetical protein
LHRGRRSPDERLKNNPPESVVYIRPEHPGNPSDSFPPSCLNRSPAGPAAAAFIFPAAGCLAGSGALLRPVQNAASRLLFFTFSPTPPLKPPENRKNRGEKHHVDRWREAALLPAPSPARSSTTTVNARPSSGSVAAPISHGPRADDAAASLRLIKPRTAAGQTRTEAVVGSRFNLGEKLDLGFGIFSICIGFFHFFP